MRHYDDKHETEIKDLETRVDEFNKALLIYDETLYTLIRRTSFLEKSIINLINAVSNHQEIIKYLVAKQ
jgi:predicted nucleic acid-binding protein